MTCRRIEPDLDAWLDGELDAEAKSLLERHASECADCHRLIERATKLRNVLAGLEVEGPDAGFFDEALTVAASSGTRRENPAVSRRYLGAIAAGFAAIAIVGVLVDRIEPETPVAGIAQVALAVEETRTINLVFASDQALDSVSLTVDLPDGIELARYPGQDRVEWSTRLQSGKNVLPLELVALGGNGGELVATMRQDGKEKVFRVSIAVLMG